MLLRLQQSERTNCANFRGECRVATSFRGNDSHSLSKKVKELLQPVANALDNRVLLSSSSSLARNRAYLRRGSHSKLLNSGG